MSPSQALLLFMMTSTSPYTHTQANNNVHLSTLPSLSLPPLRPPHRRAMSPSQALLLFMMTSTSALSVAP